MSEIQLDNISKRYKPGLGKKPVQAVRNLSLEIGRGEVFGLIGPNGAGKSTTIRLMLGLIRPDEGEIRFRGNSLKEKDIRSDIGYLPENPYLYDHLTLEELLVFCGRMTAMEPGEVARRSSLLLDKLDLQGSRRRPLRTFSKGMLQRAGICFALLHDPALVILDEPMSGLDPIGRKMVFDIVQELKGEGKTVFFCSHILSDVERLCDRIGMLVAGRLVKIFDKGDYRQDSSYPLHLVVAPLNPTQRSALAGLVGEMQPDSGDWILSIAPERLEAFAKAAAANGVEVLSSQTERVSLEKLFTTVVKEIQS